MFIYFNYILKCFSTGIYGRGYFFYRGYTDNLRRRYLQHKKGACKTTKKACGELYIIYVEILEDRNKREGRKRALKREKQMKNWNWRRIEALAIKNKKKTQMIIDKYLTNH